MDLARAICEELGIVRVCQIQAVPWQEIEEALATGKGEAIIAGLAVSARTRERFAFTRPYLHIPARFAVRQSEPLSEPVYSALAAKTVGVVRGSAQARYFTQVFPGTATAQYETAALAMASLQRGDVDAVFADAVSLSFWLASQAAADCCAFSGGPYLSPRHFGHGLAIAVDRNNAQLVEAINFALRRISDKGTFRELYLRYFPLGLY